MTLLLMKMIQLISFNRVGVVVIIILLFYFIFTTVYFPFHFSEGLFLYPLMWIVNILFIPFFLNFLISGLIAVLYTDSRYEEFKSILISMEYSK